MQSSLETDTDMGVFNFGKKYTKTDLQKEINSLAELYRQAIGLDASNKSKAQLKLELARQLYTVLSICKKGNFTGGELVEWNPGLPRSGNYTSLHSVTPMVQVLIEMM